MYFWINAFVREFIATIVSERKRHAIVLGALILFGALTALMHYLSTAVLSL
ncbi:MAG: hypothetical protein J5643_03955 [Lachnospiraceae bacterium]|nr:hypothetical protein [Lachnospiraceae bacterium]